MHIPASHDRSSQKKVPQRQLLFRKEVLEAENGQWIGSIRLAQPVSAWLIVTLAVAITFALLTFITLGAVNKKARVTGITTPIGGSLTVTSQNSGTLIKNFVVEGQQVRPGQKLFEISTERHGSNGEITALLAQQLAIRGYTLETERRTRIAQDSEKRRAIDARLINLTAETTQLEHELGLAKRRQGLAEESLRKFEILQVNGFVSPSQSQQKQEELIDISAHLSTIERSKVQLQSNRLSLMADKTALESDLATTLTQLDRSEASLRQEIVENQDKSTSLVVASQAGIITTITNQLGQAVSGGQVLATLIPKSASSSMKKDELEVHLYAPSRTAGFVALGQTVLIRYQAFPYQKFGLQEGTVTDVSRTPFPPNELPTNIASTILSNAQQTVQGFNTNEALYRIKVKLRLQTIDVYGKSQFIKPGMTLEADVLQERRKIWEWIIDPILAVTRR